MLAGRPFGSNWSLTKRHAEGSAAVESLRCIIERHVEGLVGFPANDQVRSCRRGGVEDFKRVENKVKAAMARRTPKMICGNA
jgi:hypothetical protein